MSDMLIETQSEPVDVNHLHPLDNFVQGGLDYLPSGVFEGKANILNTLTTFLDRLEIIDQKMVAMAEERLTVNAADSILDEIGEQLGIFRNGLNDPEYRAVIMILTGNNSKSGTRSDIISTLKQLFGDGGVTTYKGDNYRFDINIFNTCIEVKEILSQIIDMLPLVTHLRIVENEGYPFAFSGDDQSFGFCSVRDTDRNGLGGMSSLIYVSDDEELWSFD